MRIVLIRSRPIDSAVFKVAKALSRAGYDVEVMIWDRQNDFDNIVDEGYTIKRFCLRAPYDSSAVLIYLPLWWCYELYNLLINRYEVIHAFDLDTLYPAIIIKNLRKVPMCYTILDFYANNIPSGRLDPIRAIIRNLVASIEKFGIGFADALFLADESRLEEIKGANIKDIYYIYNSPPDLLYLNESENDELDNKFFRIFYGGAIIKSRGIEHMCKAIKNLKNVELILAGSATRDLTKEIDKYENVKYIGWLESYNEILNYTSRANLIFRFNDPRVPKTKYESPNKLFEAMMCGKPIMVSDDSRMADIVRMENCGVVVKYGDIDAIRESVLKLKNDLGYRIMLGANGRNAYEKRYSWNIMEMRLIKAYAKLMNSKNNRRRIIKCQLLD